MDVDFEIRDEGTLFLVDPISDAAQAWASQHFPEDALRWGGAYVVEHRYIEDIINGIGSDGFTIEMGGVVMITDPDTRGAT